jgi:hypothetical protein
VPVLPIGRGTGDQVTGQRTQALKGGQRWCLETSKGYVNFKTPSGVPLRVAGTMELLPYKGEFSSFKTQISIPEQYTPPPPEFRMGLTDFNIC